MKRSIVDYGSDVPTRRRRSSILKTVKSPRIVLAELDAKPITPTDQTVSRRVSFSRRTAVAEFVTHEATTTWKNLYEEHHNFTIDSIVNDFEVHCSGGPTRIPQDEFQEIEAELDEVPGPPDLPSTNTHGQHLTASLNLTEQFAALGTANYTTNLAAPVCHFDVSAKTDNNLKLFSDTTDFIIGEPSGVIEVDFSTEQLIRAPYECNKKNSSDVNNLEQAEFDYAYVNGSTNKSKSESSPARESGEADMSLTDTAVPPCLNPPAVPQSLSNKIPLNSDWIADKENILLTPPQKIKQSTVRSQEKVLVYDGKKLKYARIDDDLDDLEDPLPRRNKSYDRVYSKRGDKSITLGVTKRNSQQPNTLIFDKDDVEANMSITQSIPSSVKHCLGRRRDGENDCDSLNPKRGVSQLAKNFKKNVTVFGDNLDMSITQCVTSFKQNYTQSQNCVGTDIHPDLKPARICDIDVSLAQNSPPSPRSDVLSSVTNDKNVDNTSKRRTIVFDRNDVEADISITQCYSGRLLTNLTDPLKVNRSMIQAKEKILVYDEENLNNAKIDVDFDNLKNPILELNNTYGPRNNRKKDKSMTLDVTRMNHQQPNTMIFDAEDVEANLSITECITSTVKYNHEESKNGENNLDNLNVTVGRSKLINNYKNHVTVLCDNVDMSMTRCIPSVQQDYIQNPNFVAKDSGSESPRICDIDVSLAQNSPPSPRSDVLSSVTNDKNVDNTSKRRTIVFDRNDVEADISITQCYSGRLLTNFTDPLKVNRSMIQAKEKILVYDEENLNNAKIDVDYDNLKNPILELNNTYGPRNNRKKDKSMTLDVTRMNHQQPNTMIFDAEDVEANLSITECITSTVKYNHEESKNGENNLDNLNVTVGRSKLINNYENHVTVLCDNVDMSMTRCIPSVQQDYIQNPNFVAKDSDSESPRICDIDISSAQCSLPGPRTDVTSNLISSENLNISSWKKNNELFDRDTRKSEIPGLQYDDQHLTSSQKIDHSIIKTQKKVYLANEKKLDSTKIDDAQKINHSIKNIQENVLVFDKNILENAATDQKLDDLEDPLPRTSKNTEHQNSKREDKSMALNITRMNHCRDNALNLDNTSNLTANENANISSWDKANVLLDKDRTGAEISMTQCSHQPPIIPSKSSQKLNHPIKNTQENVLVFDENILENVATDQKLDDLEDPLPRTSKNLEHQNSKREDKSMALNITRMNHCRDNALNLDNTSNLTANENANISSWDKANVLLDKDRTGAEISMTQCSHQPPIIPSKSSQKLNHPIKNTQENVLVFDENILENVATDQKLDDLEDPLPRTSKNLEHQNSKREDKSMALNITRMNHCRDNALNLDNTSNLIANENANISSWDKANVLLDKDRTGAEISMTQCSYQPPIIPPKYSQKLNHSMKNIQENVLIFDDNKVVIAATDQKLYDLEDPLLKTSKDRDNENSKWEDKSIALDVKGMSYCQGNTSSFERDNLESNVSVSLRLHSDVKHHHKGNKNNEDNLEDADLMASTSQLTRNLKNNVTSLGGDTNLSIMGCAPMELDHTQSRNFRTKDLQLYSEPAGICDSDNFVARRTSPDRRGKDVSNFIDNRNENHATSNRHTVVFDKDDIEAEVSMMQSNNDHLIKHPTPPQKTNHSTIETQKELFSDEKKLSSAKIDDKLDDLEDSSSKTYKDHEQIYCEKEEKSTDQQILRINGQQPKKSLDRENEKTMSVTQSVPSTVKHCHKENKDVKDNPESSDHMTNVSQLTGKVKINMEVADDDAITSIAQSARTVRDVSDAAITVAPSELHSRGASNSVGNENAIHTSHMHIAAFDKDDIEADVSMTQCRNKDHVLNGENMDLSLHENLESSSNEKPVTSHEENNKVAGSQTLVTAVSIPDSSTCVTPASSSSPSKVTSTRLINSSYDTNKASEKIRTLASSRKQGLSYAAPSSTSGNLRSQIDALPFMGSRHCEWETALMLTERSEAHKRGAWWWFRLLHTRLRLGIRIANVAGDAVLAEVEVTPDLKDCRDPIVSLCVRLAAEAARVVCAKESGATATRTPMLLQRLVELSRLAAQWGRALHDARLSLALAVEEHGYISLNVANVPLRCVWEVKMHVELDRSEEPARTPWPRAVRVSARLASPGKAVALGAGELQSILRGVPHNWGHVPTTIWRVFRYLKNQRCYKASLGT